MKFIKSLILCFIVFFSTNSYAQNLGCSTDQNVEFIKRLENNVANSYAKKMVARFVPVQIHLVADNDGSNTITEDEIVSKMCILNERYADIEMHFYLDGINIINNTNLNQRQNLASSRTLMRNEKNQSALNIFLVSEILSNDFSPTNSAGFYTSNGDYVVMLQSTPGDDGYTMEHEIGHFFSLSHTHFGWEGNLASTETVNGYDPDVHGDTVRIEIITGSTQAPPSEVELVDGSNCTTAGDRICDTPPDYGFGQACSCCTMRWDVWDRNGDKIEPMMDNIMSYSNNCSEMFFTEGQRDAMFTDFDSSSRTFLRVGEVSEYTPITEEVTITSPMVGDKFDNFDGVLVEWDAVENAEYYVINISGGQQLQYRSNDTEVYIADLQPSALYFVDVKAYNRFGTGCQNSIRVFFETGAGSTSVNETESINNINVYPNPVKNAQDLIIDYTSDKNIDSKIRLHNLQGKVVELINTTFVAGNNNIKINTKSLVSGLYILEIETAEGIISEKIIVE